MFSDFPILESSTYFNKSNNCISSLIKRKKSTSRPDFMAQACLTFALNFTSQRKLFDGLKNNLFAEKVQHSSCNSFYLEDLVRLR